MSDADRNAGEEMETLAAEYVMGLVPFGDMARVQALIGKDPSFAALVEAWHRRLGALDETAADERVTEELWARIDQSIEHGGEAAAAPDPVAAAIAAPVARAVTATPSRLPGLWESLAFWRMAGLSALAASLVLAVGTGYFAIKASRQPVLVAVLMTDQNEAAAVVNAFADGSAELRALRPIDIPPGRAIEIWTLWDRGIGPKSIGLIQSVSGKVSLRLDGLPKPAAGQLFEMTLEPASGSPVGRPTGPVLNKGNAAMAL